MLPDVNDIKFFSCLQSYIDILRLTQEITQLYIFFLNLNFLSLSFNRCGNIVHEIWQQLFLFQ